VPCRAGLGCGVYVAEPATPAVVPARANTTFGISTWKLLRWNLKKEKLCSGMQKYFSRSVNEILLLE
jgi:hypothetical protein